MTTETKPVNRLAGIDGVPEPAPENQQAVLPSPFDKLLAELRAAPPFKGLAAATAERDLFTHFCQAVALVKARTDEWNRLYEAVLRAGVVVRLGREDQKLRQELTEK